MCLLLADFSGGNEGYSCNKGALRPSPREMGSVPNLTLAGQPR
jgi:hypothetical protein